MRVTEQPLDDRLDALSEEWRQLGYTGPALIPAETAARPAVFTWLAPAAVAAAVLALWLWPGAQPAPEWPENLRPVVRGSPFAIDAPARPPDSVAFRFPRSPVRQSCIAPASACDQPAG